MDDVYVAYADRDMPPDLHPMFPWSSDSTIHFLIDGDHSGGKAISSDGGSPQERSYQDNVGTQYFMVAGDNNLREDGQHISLMQNGFSYRKNWFYSPPYAEGGSGISEGESTRIITEFYVTPMDSLMWDDSGMTRFSELWMGKTIGFSFAVIDRDDPGSDVWHGVFQLPKTVAGFVADEGFVDGLLVDSQGKVPEGTVVDRESWARVKKSNSR